MIIRQEMPKGYCWLYAARGPLIQNDQMNALLEALKPLAKKENAVFLRIDPPVTKKYNIKGFKETHSGFQPEHTLIIDLSKSEEEILNSGRDMSEEQIEQALSFTEKFVANPVALSIWGFVYSIFAATFLSLIIAIFAKREKPVEIKVEQGTEE